MKSSWKRLWMLVSVLVLVGSLAGCGLFGDDDDNGEEEDPKTVTVYFYNSEGWDEVYAYSDDVEGMEDPGEEADEDSDADDWYMIEIERDVLRDPMDVVFHNNDGEEAETVTIDHPNQVYVTAKGDVFGSMGGVEDEMNATLYFYNSEEWDNVHVQSDDIDALSDNPEVDEDPDNEDWYSVTVPANLSDTPISVTFNDGDVSTGTELNLDDHSKTYLTVLEDGVYSSMDSAESAISGVSTTVYFYNTEEWDDVYAWAWTDDGDIFESWPGEAAEEVEDQDGWYSIDLPGIESTDSLEIIFNNNDGDDTIQTDDTPFASEDDLYVVFEGDGEVASTYESFDEAESASEQVTFDLWFYNDQGWDSVYADAEDDDGESVLDGAEATQDGDTDWWSIEVPADLEEVDVDVTFHDNDDSEGDTITIEDEDDYYLTSDKDVMYEGRTKVYFNNEDEWADVYADVETDEDTPESFLTDVEALQDGDSDWYFVDIPVNFSDDDYTITFHDGDDDEAPAAELTDSSDKYITMTEDETYSTLNQAEAWMDAASEDFVTVYYYNSEGWDLENINGYNWSTVDSLNEVLGAWPGMSVEEDPDDSDWVMIDVPLDFDDISGEDDTFTMIFNN
ncbi:MAG: starch-binding protein, partial [Bacillota bacterium]